MKLKQLECITTIVRCGFNISQAANVLHTTQPGVSAQLRLLEEELGNRIFVRNGKRITGLTPAGEVIALLAEETLLKTEAIRQVSEELKHEDRGTLTIATTHTQARYALPDAITRFMREFPKVQLHIDQGNPEEVAQMVVKGGADLAIATEAIGKHEELLMLPVYRWNRCVVATPGHPVFTQQPLTLEGIARFPLITYSATFTGREAMNKVFAERGLNPEIVLTAIDSDVIKHYVGLGLGVGVLARMAYDPAQDTHLQSADVGHLFPDNVTGIAIRRGRFLRHYMYRFIEIFAPHLNRKFIESAQEEGAVNMAGVVLRTL